MRNILLLSLLACCLTALLSPAKADEPKVAANLFNQASDDFLISPTRANDGEKSRLLPDPQARTGFALVADPADKPGRGYLWYGYTYQQGPGKIRATFRLKVADNTSDKPVANIRGWISNTDLKAGTGADRTLKGTDFAAPNTYQEFSIEMLKGEQGFGDWGVSTFGVTKVSYDGLSVTQLSKFEMADLLPLINAPVKPDKLTLSTDAFRVHETHGLFMEQWNVRTAVAFQQGGAWTQSYLNVHPQRTALDGFPKSWPALYQQRAVVLNNVPAKAVAIVGTLMLKQYVEDGGCLVMLGDTHAFAAGGWEKTVLAPLLPIEMKEGQQILHADKPLVLAPVSNGLRGLPLAWRLKPVTYYYHAATLKPGAQVLLSANGLPMAVEGHAGKGRVIVLLLSVCGEQPAGSAGVPFWQWKDWPALLSAILAGE